MKKVLSLILAVAMLASFAMVASAADVMTFDLFIGNIDGDPVEEINAGETFYIYVTADTATDKFGVEMAFDTTNFEIAKFSGVDDTDFSPYTGAAVMNPDGKENVISFGGVQAAARLKKLDGYIGVTAKATAASGVYTFGSIVEQAKNMPTGMTAEGNDVTIKVNGTSTEPAEYNVTYAANDFVVWGNTPATTTDKVVKFEATPAFGYMITEVNGEAVANTAGGEYDVALTADTEIVVTVAAIDTKVIATSYVDAENGLTYIFGKANFVPAECGVALTKDGEAVPAFVDGAYKADGKYAATANANGAFGVAFEFNSVNGLFTGIDATAYADSETATAIAIN